MKEILETIKKKRLLKGISQKSMGRRLNMVSSAYGKIERGQTDLTVARLIQICGILELNSYELIKQFSSAKENDATSENYKTISVAYELDLSKKINYMFKMFVNDLVEEKYRQIMKDYPFTEFTAEDWWASLGCNQEEKLGMNEEEFWDVYGGGYQEIFKPEDEYEGFKKLIKDASTFYFFKLGLIENQELISLFQLHISKESTTQFPLNAKLSAARVNDYLKTLTDIDIYEEPNDSFAH